jgi:hypothetical protein
MASKQTVSFWTHLKSLSVFLVCVLWYCRNEIGRALQEATVPPSSRRNTAASLMFENCFPSLRLPQLFLSRVLTVSPLPQRLISGSVSPAKKPLKTWP